MRYIKKYSIVEAYQWNPVPIDDGALFWCNVDHPGLKAREHTHVGGTVAVSGDWIVTVDPGHKLVYNESDFEKYYTVEA